MPKAQATAFETTIRLPPHRLQLDEQEFLRLLAASVSLLKAEKRKVIEAVPRMSQYQVDEVLEIMADELEDVRRSGWQWGKAWEGIRERQAQWWKELEREMGN